MKIIAKILIGSCAVVGMLTPLSAASIKDLTLVYLANFGGASLESSVDKLGIGPLKAGHSQVAGTNPTWTPRNGTLELGITRPATLTGGVVAAGVFATPVTFDAESQFKLRATYIAPTGPHATGNVWAAALAARTGDEDDLSAEKRIVVSLTVRAASARLNVVGASVPPNLPNLPQQVYDAIFHPTDPEPFTLELQFDRITGDGVATLKVGESVISHNFQSSIFPAHSGPTISAVGPVIAIANGPGQSASVRVRDFRISAVKQQRPGGQGAELCPPEFGCRTSP